MFVLIFFQLTLKSDLKEVQFTQNYLFELRYTYQGRNHRKNLGATSAMVGRICPPVCNRVKVSQNLGATAVAPVAPVDPCMTKQILDNLWMTHLATSLE